MVESSSSSHRNALSPSTSSTSGVTTVLTTGPTSFFSKITRSPSKRHKPLGSNNSIDTTLNAPASASRSRSRQPFSRTPTAPAAPSSISSSKPDVITRTTSDVTGTSTPSSSESPNMFMVVNPVALPAPPNSGNTLRNPLPRTTTHDDQSRLPTPTGNHGIGEGFKAVPGDADVPSALALNGMLTNGSAQYSSTSLLHAHLQEMTNKRIATLDYLRKAHEGRSFWFNTVRFTESDIGRLPSYTPSRLSRRATNYMLLGMSLPIILDVHPQPHPQSASSTNTAVAQDYLRSLIALLTEFESFQQLHPPDGSTASSLSRARIPQMFKRAATTSRPRKSSGPVSEIGAPMLPTQSSPPNLPDSGIHHGSHASIDTTTTGTSFPSNASIATTLVNSSSSTPMAVSNFTNVSAFPPPAPFDAPNSTLLANEGPYTYLQTPPLPFVPDFFTVFATLCDVLIETYQRLMQILINPTACTPVINDLFTKVDGRIRKVMISATIREFETSSRDMVKREMMGVQKVVLGGLMV
ncbi:hypothetical protein PV10_08557 [Exophiala mesophila]|uniref:Uncharacterized protein n=1 Tax=Exophiala mesophila TaxID=212818 RepID=A0A0D1WJ63_EXOME|nr:uncharacterized protein PV10_08557 [Exophiala mesophila]KIV88930.1 hypothetical protein PV10_08557 [Exophiala mesophila]